MTSPKFLESSGSPLARASAPLAVATLSSLFALSLSLIGGVADAKTPNDHKSDEDEVVDWRGLHRMDDTGTTIKKQRPPPSPVTALIQNAPYRVHVASTDGQKITITDAFTLERRRVFVAKSIQGYAFSNDGHYLYVVHDRGTVSSVVVQTAKVRKMGRIRLRKSESVIQLIGRGSETQEYVTVLLGRGPAWHVGDPCRSRTVSRQVHLRRLSSGRVRIVIKKGPPDLKARRRRKATSPNTRFVVQLVGRTLISRSRMGSPESRLNRRPLLAGATALRWMRDSRGVMIFARRLRRQGCNYRLGLESLRQPLAQRASWRRQHDWPSWTMPEDVKIVRGDLSYQNPEVTTDGMRIVGHDSRGVVLIEPSPRFRGHVALIAPPSTLWPIVRPGVRSLTTGAGSSRIAEILMEQGDLDASRAQIRTDKLKKKPRRRAKKDPTITRIEVRLAKLEKVRERRAREFDMDIQELRSKPPVISDTSPPSAKNDSISPTPK